MTAAAEMSDSGMWQHGGWGGSESSCLGTGPENRAVVEGSVSDRCSERARGLSVCPDRTQEEINALGELKNPRFWLVFVMELLSYLDMSVCLSV